MNGYLIGTLALSLGLVGCGAPTGPSPVSDTEDLIVGLRQAGALVEARGKLPQTSNPYFSVEAAVFAVNDAEPRMHVFEYATREQADVEAALVDHDGRRIGPRPGGPTFVHICWIGTPHFYRAGRLIVLYTGDDSAVLALLQHHLSRPFAGGSPNPPGTVCR